MRGRTQPTHSYRRAWQEGGLRAIGRAWVARWPRQISPTKTGWVFFLFLVIIALLAYSTGNNLLFLLFAAMLAFFLISGFLSEASVGSLKLTVNWPQEWHAGEATRASLRLDNQARRLDAYLVELRHPELFGHAPPPRLVHLPARGTLTLALTLQAPRRGLYRPAPFVLATVYPFLLLTKTRQCPQEEELLVYPAWRPITQVPEWLAAASGPGEASRAQEGDVDHLREWRQGEAQNRIHWKKSAGAQDKLLVKELANPQKPQVALRFCPQGARHLEAGIERLTAWVQYLSARGWPIFLGLEAKEPWSRALSRREALTALALYELPQDAPAAPPAFVEITVAADGTERLRQGSRAGGGA